MRLRRMPGLRCTTRSDVNMQGELFCTPSSIAGSALHAAARRHRHCMPNAADSTRFDLASTCPQVFDITEWIPEHPGGPVIIEYIGTDATDVFIQVNASSCCSRLPFVHAPATDAHLLAALCDECRCTATSCPRRRRR